MRKNKKSAIEASTLVLYIILIATTLTLAGAVVMYSKLASKDIRKRACEWDITKAYYSKLVPKGIVRGDTIFGINNCRRDKLGDLTIRYNDIVDKGIINQDKAHKIITDEMIECWKMVGEGKVDPFSNWGTMDTSYCMICSTIKFDDKLIEFMKKGNEKLAEEIKKSNKEITEEELGKYNILSIYDYMVNKEYKPGVKIIEYLYNIKNVALTQNDVDNELEKVGKKEVQILLPDSIIFLKMYKYKDKNKFWTIVGAITGGLLVIGGVILLIFTGWTGIGAILSGALLKVGLSLLVATGLITIGAFILIPTAQNAWDACVPECNAIGGIGLIPAELNLDVKLPVQIDGKEEQKPVCDIVVN